MGCKQNIIGVGMSQDPNPTQAGQQAAAMALSMLGSDETIAWTLAFCGGRHDSEAVLQALRAQLGEVELVGDWPGYDSARTGR